MAALDGLAGRRGVLRFKSLPALGGPRKWPVGGLLFFLYLLALFTLAHVYISVAIVGFDGDFNGRSDGWFVRGPEALTCSLLLFTIFNLATPSILEASSGLTVISL